MRPVNSPRLLLECCNTLASLVQVFNSCGLQFLAVLPPQRAVSEPQVAPENGQNHRNARPSHGHSGTHEACSQPQIALGVLPYPCQSLTSFQQLWDAISGHAFASTCRFKAAGGA